MSLLMEKNQKNLPSTLEYRKEKYSIPFFSSIISTTYHMPLNHL